MAPRETDTQAALPEPFFERLAQLAQQTPAMALQVGFGRVVWHSGADSLKVLTQHCFEQPYAALSAAKPLLRKILLTDPDLFD